EASLLARATVFTDEVAQSVSIGEAQHAVAQGLVQPGDITEIGAVLIGAHPGRRRADEITLFDGTGVGLQDLAVAAQAVSRAVERGLAIEVGL
ncbi:MAG: ornithine cyclodeaminase family protein, partial [Paracoccaceae bacterium]|nr:ornithine cyclodeaminase family protein [Paracoccaceae bacterium]